VRPLVVVTRRPPGNALDAVAAAARIRLWDGHAPVPAGVLRRWVGDADGLYCMLTDTIDRSVLDAGPRLRVISQMAVGVDNVDLAACAERAIPVGHTPEVLTESTADLAMALLLAAGRRLAEGIDHVRSGAWGPWQPELLLGHDLHHTTLGIIGMGRIGRAVARRATGFSMRVLYTGPTAKTGVDADYVPLEALLAEADHVVLTAPLTPDTHHLIGREALEAMKPTAVLVNVSRGPLVDTDALVDALMRGSIAAAGLDVTDPEPITADHPLVDLPNCLIVPHVGSATVVTREAMAGLAARNLLAGLRGDPLPASVR
jgi:lactate dehydrogenase-like 2-hydroxyacid dehydrogenase